MPKLDDAGDCQNAETQGEQSHGGLRGEEQLSTVEMIGRKTGQGQEKNLWPKLEGHDYADGGGIFMRELGEDEPVLRDTLHPCPDIGDEGADRPDPIVEALERAKSVFHLSARESNE